MSPVIKWRRIGIEVFVLVAVVDLSPKQNLIYEKINKGDPISQLGTTDAWRHIILCCRGCSVHCRVTTVFAGSYSLDASSTLRHCQMSDSQGWETNDLGREPPQ